MSSATERTSLLSVDPLLNGDDSSAALGNMEAAASSRQDETFSFRDTISRSQHSAFHKREVEYDGDNHLAVLLQMYGSVWPHVFPWCIATLVVTYAIMALRNHDIIDLTISNNNGHSFMSILVSFLVVTRATITYSRFMEARGYLADLYRSAREIVQYSCILTLTDKGPAAQQWRQDIAYRTIVTLRMAVAAIEFRSHGINAWEALPEEDHERMELIVNDTQETQDRSSVQHYKPSTDHSSFLTTMAHGPRTLTDENFRAPIVWAYNLREKILEPRNNPSILVNRPFHVNEELRLLALSSEFVQAFHGLKKLITTPFPFPLVQMTRTFLFFWVFSLPMVIINDNDQMVEVLILMFFCTYGFLGLEYVNMELDDPYGEDPNDFPGQRWAEIVYEDIYICVYKTDGYQNAAKLRSRITARIAKGDALENYRDDVSASLFAILG